MNTDFVQLTEVSRIPEGSIWSFEVARKCVRIHQMQHVSKQLQFHVDALTNRVTVVQEPSTFSAFVDSITIVALHAAQWVLRTDLTGTGTCAARSSSSSIGEPTFVVSTVVLRN